MSVQRTLIIRTLTVANDRSSSGNTLGKKYMAHVENPGKSREKTDFWDDRDRG